MQENLSGQQVRQQASSSRKQKLENEFLSHWVLLHGNLPEPARQHPIRNPNTGRDWKLDFAWVQEKLAVEIQGGSYLAKGGHNTAAGQAKDYIRHNHLTRNGWRVLYFNTPMLKHMAAVVEEVAEVLCGAVEIQEKT
jgi:very-short-patch-repair endonuclease